MAKAAKNSSSTGTTGATAAQKQNASLTSKARSSIPPVPPLKPNKKAGFIAHLHHSILIWIYQYELTFGLYMLDPWEKTVFNTFIGLLFVLGSYATWRVLPEYARYMIQQGIYYLAPIDAPVDPAGRTAL
ncbi:hypothetical protein BJ742DRAFT_819851 [Cladochytrium replicatum]|nr:hypothetical protein BJ742DRAFT_819851 [Cladochytrium replicatum]